MESIINECLSDFFEQHIKISDNQFGFRKNRSTVTQLLVTINEWSQSLDEGKCIDSFFLDITKAFDTVSHVKLLEVLKSKGVGGNLLLWIENYLTDRKQFVEIDGERSNLLPVCSGVPQGGILSPKFFSAFIDTFGDEFEHLQVKLFADDAKCFASFDLLFAPDLQHDLDLIHQWSTNFQLELAPNKCCVMHLGYNNPEIPYNINNVALSTTTLIKDLGVHTAPSLKFSEHCSKIARTGFMKVNLLYSAFMCRKPNFLVQMFCVFIRPSLEYASEIWSPYHVKDVELIERVQRRFTKRIPGLSALTYEERLIQLDLKSLKHRRIVKDLVMVYKIIYNVVDLNFDEFFEFSRENRTRGHSKKLVVNRFRLDIRKHAFACRVLNAWNSLTEEIVTAPSVRIFRDSVNELTF